MLILYHHNSTWTPIFSHWPSEVPSGSTFFPLVVPTPAVNCFVRLRAQSPPPGCTTPRQGRTRPDRHLVSHILYLLGFHRSRKVIRPDPYRDVCDLRARPASHSSAAKAQQLPANNVNAGVLFMQPALQRAIA